MNVSFYTPRGGGGVEEGISFQIYNEKTKFATLESTLMKSLNTKEYSQRSYRVFSMDWGVIHSLMRLLVFEQKTKSNSTIIFSKIGNLLIDSPINTLNLNGMKVKKHRRF